MTLSAAAPHQSDSFLCFVESMLAFADGRSKVERVRDKLGICQWFHYGDHEEVERTVEELHALGVRHVRTGVSWADYHRAHGRQWYDWQMAMLSDFEVLLSVWHTPPSLAEGEACSGPPRRLQDYADFIDTLIEAYGDQFAQLELWNEPNNRLKWNFERYDPDWSKFARMVSMAGNWARHRGKTTVLGGMIPVDHHWLELMHRHGALEHMDVVAIHGFPGMWWPDAPNWDWLSHWRGWADKVEVVTPGARGRPIWVTETGRATWDLPAGRRGLYDEQVLALREAAAAPAERVYWYCLFDLHPSRDAIEGFHVDENEYHLGLLTHEGQRKPAWYELRRLLRNG